MKIEHTKRKIRMGPIVHDMETNLLAKQKRQRDEDSDTTESSTKN